MAVRSRRLSTMGVSSSRLSCGTHDSNHGVQIRVVWFLAILALVTRVQLFGDVLADSDEGFYLLVGERLLRGSVLYLDIWDRKPAGLFLLFAGMRLLGGDGVLAYQSVGTIFAFATAWLIAKIAGRYSHPFAAAAAGAAYLLWLPLGSAAGGQAELFGNLPMAGAALLTLRGLEQSAGTRSLRLGAMAMLLIGLAMQIKYTALFAGVFLGCCWIWSAWRTLSLAACVALAAWWILAALAPTLLVAVWYAAHGHMDAFLYANFVSVWHRTAPSMIDRLRDLSLLALIIAPLLLCVWASRPLPSGRMAHRFVLGWLVAAMAGLLGFGTFMQQFLLPVVTPASAAAAPAFGKMRRWAVVVVLATVFALGQGALAISHCVHGSDREARKIVSAVDPRGCMFIYSGVAALYRLANACIPTKYVFPSLLSRQRESDAIGVDQVREVARVMETRPATVIVRSPYDGENWRARAVVLRQVRQSYHLVLRQQLGERTVSVYRWGPPNRDRGASRSPCRALLSDALHQQNAAHRLEGTRLADFAPGRFKVDMCTSALPGLRLPSMLDS